ncbi:hypothetical protein [Nocardia sp. NPDC049149]|uniref:hypothetical protein n=1 Tax=Nocardia sp. NPDC049149 TaxID=3364315 RepID=UPI0037135CD1
MTSAKHAGLLLLEALAATVVCLGVATAGTPAISQAAPNTGAVDMNDYCNWRYGGATAQVLDPHSAFSWNCMHGPAIAGGVDVDVQCRRQYGTFTFSRFGDTRDPYSWFCQWTRTGPG